MTLAARARYIQNNFGSGSDLSKFFHTWTALFILQGHLFLSEFGIEGESVGEDEDEEKNNPDSYPHSRTPTHYNIVLEKISR
jgi:hypothetical protein